MWWFVTCGHLAYGQILITARADFVLNRVDFGLKLRNLLLECRDFVTLLDQNIAQILYLLFLMRQRFFDFGCLFAHPVAPYSA